MTAILNTLIQIVSLLAVFLVIVGAGSYFSKNKDAASNMKKSLLNFHEGLGTIGIGILFVLIFFFYYVMVQNVSVFMEANLNVPNAAGVLIGFVTFSIASNSLGAIQIKKFTEDRKLTFPEIVYTVVFFLLAVSAEGIIIYYGFVVHKWYYLNEISLAVQYAEDITNPIYGFSETEIETISRKVLVSINELKTQAWKGEERMNILMIEAAFNMISIFSTTIGFAIYSVSASTSTTASTVATGGAASPIPPITSRPSPFRIP